MFSCENFLIDLPSGLRLVSEVEGSAILRTRVSNVPHSLLRIGRWFSGPGMFTVQLRNKLEVLIFNFFLFLLLLKCMFLSRTGSTKGSWLNFVVWCADGQQD